MTDPTAPQNPNEGPLEALPTARMRHWNLAADMLKKQDNASTPGGVIGDDISAHDVLELADWLMKPPAADA